MKKFPVEVVIHANGGAYKSTIVLIVLLNMFFTWGFGYFVYYIFQAETSYPIFLGCVVVTLGLACALFTIWQVPYKLVLRRREIVRNVEDNLILQNCLIDAGLAGDFTIKMKLE